MILLATVALAASSGGFRTPSGAALSGVSLRMASVLDPIGLAIVQGTLRAELTSPYFLDEGVEPRFGLVAELPAGAGWGTTGWEDTAFGNWRVEALLHFDDPDIPWSIGLALVAPTELEGSQPAFWGTVGAEMLPVFAPMLVTRWSVLPDTPLVFQAELGFVPDRSIVGDEPPIWFGLLVSMTSPVSPHLAIVGEVEWRLDPTPLTVRPLLRWDATRHLSLDAGIQLPSTLLIRPTAQPIAQARALF